MFSFANTAKEYSLSFEDCLIEEVDKNTKFITKGKNQNRIAVVKRVNPAAKTTIMNGMSSKWETLKLKNFIKTEKNVETIENNNPNNENPNFKVISVSTQNEKSFKYSFSAKTKNGFLKILNNLKNFININEPFFNRFNLFLNVNETNQTIELFLKISPLQLIKIKNKFQLGNRKNFLQASYKILNEDNNVILNDNNHTNIFEGRLNKPCEDCHESYENCAKLLQFGRNFKLSATLDQFKKNINDVLGNNEEKFNLENNFKCGVDEDAILKKIPSLNYFINSILSMSLTLKLKTKELEDCIALETPYAMQVDNLMIDDEPFEITNFDVVNETYENFDKAINFNNPSVDDGGIIEKIIVNEDDESDWTFSQFRSLFVADEFQNDSFSCDNLPQNNLDEEKNISSNFENIKEISDNFNKIEACLDNLKTENDNENNSNNYINLNENISDSDNSNNNIFKIIESINSNSSDTSNINFSIIINNDLNQDLDENDNENNSNNYIILNENISDSDNSNNNIQNENFENYRLDDNNIFKPIESINSNGDNLSSHNALSETTYSGSDRSGNDLEIINVVQENNNILYNIPNFISGKDKRDDDEGYNIPYNSVDDHILENNIEINSDASGENNYLNDSSILEEVEINNNLDFFLNDNDILIKVDDSESDSLDAHNLNDNEDYLNNYSLNDVFAEDRLNENIFESHVSNNDSLAIIKKRNSKKLNWNSENILKFDNEEGEEDTDDDDKNENDKNDENNNSEDGNEETFIEINLKPIQELNKNFLERNKNDEADFNNNDDDKNDNAEMNENDENSNSEDGNEETFIEINLKPIQELNKNFLEKNRNEEADFNNNDKEMNPLTFITTNVNEGGDEENREELSESSFGFHGFNPIHSNNFNYLNSNFFDKNSMTMGSNDFSEKSFKTFQLNYVITQMFENFFEMDSKKMNHHKALTEFNLIGITPKMLNGLNKISEIDEKIKEIYNEELSYNDIEFEDNLEIRKIYKKEITEQKNKKIKEATKKIKKIIKKRKMAAVN